MTRLLIIQHEDNCGPGWFGQWWREAGADLTVVAADAEPLPTTLDGYDGLVVLGGSMGATADDKAPWLPGTRSLILAAIGDDRLPFLGICLGHQLAAVARGGRIGRNRGLTLGLTRVGVTEAGRRDQLFGPLPVNAVAIQYNYDHVVEIPTGAVVLASAPDEHIQGLRYGPRAWGVQFHPEVTPAGFDEWTVDKPEDAAEREALSQFNLPGLSRAAHEAHDNLTNTWRPFAVRFLEVAAAVARERGTSS